MKYLREQMQTTLQSQRATDYFARFKSYLAEKLQQSAGSNTGSELTGNGRLKSKTYKLDEMKNVAVVIDLGHGNTYEEGTTSLDRPVLIVLNTGGLTQGCGAQASLGILYHYGNDAVYEGGSPAYAPPGISYHKWPACGGNFSFVINEKGNSNFSFGGQQPTPLEPEAGGPPDRPERRFLGRRFGAQ
jgi:hypothetical protein